MGSSTEAGNARSPTLSSPSWAGQCSSIDITHTRFHVTVFSTLQQKIKDGPRGNGTAFKKCGGTFFGGSERCFEVTLRKFQVQIGAQGTDDDVRIKVCSDDKNDKKACCTTPPLKKTFSDDWSSNDLEQWGPDYFGPCKGKKFLVRRGLDVTIEKDGKSALQVTSLFIEADGVTTNPKLKSPERFECGRFSVAKNTAKSKTNFCGTGPYSYERVKEIKVAIGPDGTNGLTSCSNSNFHQSQHSSDDVRAEFCSDVDSVCCRTKLSTLLHDDWSKNDDEQWGESDLGSCKTTLYKVRNGIRFTLLKNGKDDLQVNKLVVGTENLRGVKFSYDCKDFKLASQGTPCVEGVTCKQEKVCPKKPSGRATTKKPGSKRTTTTRRPNRTTAKGVTSTKKAGLIDRIKDSLGFGGKGSTSSTTTTKSLLSQSGSLLTTKAPTSTTTTRPPFRG